MTLFYDNLVYSLQHFGGISTYWFELTQRLLKERELEIKFYETGKEDSNICRRKLNIAKNQVIRSNRAGIMVERFLKLPPHPGPHIFHSSYFRVPVKTRQTKTVCTVHDFVHDLYFSGPRVWLHNRMKKQAILESDVIIAVSQNTKVDLLKFYPQIKEGRVKVIHNGVSENFKMLDKPMRVERPFFLYLGLRDNYKNFGFAVKVAADDPEFDLTIVGPPLTAPEIALLEKTMPGRYNVFTGIDDMLLNELYNAAYCLLYPSEYEGFGIPILEAMRAGCPFIALNKSAIPEVAGNAGVLLEAADLDEARQAVRFIDRNRSEVISKGLRQANKFSWASSFEQTFKLYKTLQ